MRVEGVEAGIEVAVERGHITIAVGRLELEDSDQFLKPVQLGFPPVVANPPGQTQLRQCGLIPGALSEPFLRHPGSRYRITRL